MRVSLFWRVLAVNAGLLGGIAVLLLVSPVEIDSPIGTRQASIVVGGLAIALAGNALLLRRAFVPLERLAQRMDAVDLLRPGQRLPVGRRDEVGAVVVAFSRMLERLERQRQMRERALLIGGALAIEEGVAGGVDVRLEVPAPPVAQVVAVD